MALILHSQAAPPAMDLLLRYAQEVEQPDSNEPVLFDELSRTMEHITRTMAARYRHAYRPVHAKSHGLLVGQFHVHAGLPTELAQGLFHEPAAFPALLRFSTNPGDLLADNVSSPRGLAVKVMGVPGQRVAEDADGSSQDFVCIDTDVFAAPGPAEFLKQLKTFDKHLETSEGVKHAVSVAARGANAALSAVGISSSTLEGIGAPAVHILGESFTTVAPIRYGSYIAKVGFSPASAELQQLTGKHVDLDRDYNALEELIRLFFRKQDAAWDVKVQLALAPDPRGSSDDFPIEDASKRWPADRSPWQTVGQLVVPAQNSYSDARQLFVDERVSFTPWHALEAHRPLGGVMRSRLKAYREAVRYRATRNGAERVEPRTPSEIPA